jgi:2-methylcitrate dehydratase
MADKETVRDLAKWVLSLDAKTLPPAVLEQTKLLILDSIGCTLATLEEHEVTEALDAIEGLGGAPQCTVVGRADKTSVVNAVLANGILVRYLDLNDFMIGEGDGPGKRAIGGHPSDNIAVGLSVGEWQGSSGLDVIAAVVIGYEIYDRLKEMADRNQPWDGTSASGLVASAMAGRLMGLDATKLAHALALGAARCVTPSIMRSGNISAAKFLSNPLVAQSGVTAAVLAAGGMTGPLAVLDHPDGISSLYLNADATPLVAPCPETFAIIGSNIKAYPCLATGQAIVAAGCKVHEILGGATDKIEKIEVSMGNNPFVQRQQADEKRRFPNSREAADHSFYFLAVAGIMDGTLTPQSFDGDRWTEPKIKALMDKTSMHTDGKLDGLAPEGYPCAIRVVLSDGKEHRTEVGYAPGFSHGGLKAEEVHAKFDNVTSQALTAAQATTLKELVGNLETLPSIGDVMKLVAGKRRAAVAAQ